ncbi:MAG: PilT/PilU family type 4a pilus ATPase [Synergistes sp.]|nr:PilT/PilU family type 4a pilus ATPase [Synergistes sp.]
MADMLISQILTCASERGASDVHLSVGTAPVLRINGLLCQTDSFDVLSQSDMEEIISCLLPYDDICHAKDLRDRDFAFSTEINGKKRRFRINLYRESGNFAVAVRIVDSTVRTIDELGLPKWLKTAVKMRNGLIVVTGPAGSGKSTTLAAMIEEINASRKAHIVTIEDPVEYIFTPRLSLIHRREIGRDAASFAQAVRSAMRQDPDVLMIGEMRDLDTVSAAVTAAETGHLVLATLHTSGAAQSIDRIIGMYPPHRQGEARARLASLLIGVLSQQLVPAAADGRIAASELLIATAAVKNYIREGKTQQIANAAATGGVYGMYTMAQNIERLISENKIKRDDVMLCTVAQ